MASGSSERANETVVKIWQRNLVSADERKACEGPSEAPAGFPSGAHALGAFSPLDCSPVHHDHGTGQVVDGQRSTCSTLHAPQAGTTTAPSTQRASGRSLSLPPMRRVLSTATTMLPTLPCTTVTSISTSSALAGAEMIPAQREAEIVSMPPTVTETFAHLVSLLRSKAIVRVGIVVAETRGAWTKHRREDPLLLLSLTASLTILHRHIGCHLGRGKHTILLGTCSARALWDGKPKTLLLATRLIRTSR